MSEIDFKDILSPRLINEYKSPSRSDYEKYLINTANFNSIKEVWNNDEITESVQSHWHSIAANGCVFSAMCIRPQFNSRWRIEVVRLESSWFKSNKAKINKIIEESIRSEDCEMLSLLFPNIVSIEDLSTLIKEIRKLRLVKELDHLNYNDHKLISFRLSLGQEVLSWMMLFGPFDFFPNTRQSPVCELIFRVKPKPPNQYHQLTKGDKEAHLADYNLPLEQKRMDPLWSLTMERTRKILGTPPDEISAARTTLSIPNKEYHLFQ